MTDYEHKRLHKICPTAYDKGDVLRKKLLLALLGKKRSRQYYDYGNLEEIFFQQVYSKLYLAIKPNTTVLDLGASIGDTAIYFAMNHHVKKVYAFELVPLTYEEAKKNIGKTPFKGKIILKNAGVASKGRTIYVEQETFGDGASRVSDVEGSRGKKIRLIPLNEILKGKSNVVIKSDCEGAEADMFDNADLSKVYAIELEYHDCRDKVKKTLESKGFKVIIVSGLKSQGIMYASRSR